MPRAKRGQGGCGDPNKYHKVSRLRRVCVAIHGRRRTCKSGVRLANGKCKRSALSPEQKARGRLLAKATRMGKRINQKRADSNIGKAFRAIKRSAARSANSGEISFKGQSGNKG